MNKIDTSKLDSNIVLLGAICALGTIYHGLFFGLNDIMKIADSFAYMQMSHFISLFSQQGLGNGWFGFIYSLPLAFIEIFTGNDFLAAKIVNLLLINISAVLLWNISRKILSAGYSHFVILLLFLSPTLLHFNIHVLSENIYIPLFLGLFLMVTHFIETPKALTSIGIACLIGLMYLTRAEAFIYIGSIGIISLVMLIKKQLSVQQFFGYAGVFFISFFIFILPYLFHLHSLTGEWGLTNKGASNLRQAELRGQERMDDSGFEKAVAELTPDNKHLISGFAGGMPYDAPSIKGSLGEFIFKDPIAFLNRVLVNQQKLYSKNIPEIILGKSPGLYYSDDVRFNNIVFLIYSIIPLLLVMYGAIMLYIKQRNFFIISISFFIPACVFFTLFFTLNRYFLIFLPLFYIAAVYGISQIKIGKNSPLVQVILGLQLVSLLGLSTFVYYNTESPKDSYYSLKKTAGEWLENYCIQDIDANLCSNNSSTDLKIMERFPIVTYYSGSKTRYITPYTQDISDIYEYGSYRNIDILVVDTMDFQTYRPGLTQYLEQTPDRFKKLQEFTNKEGQKVILYQLKK